MEDNIICTERFIPGSGNVFEDLNLADASLELIKAQMAAAIRESIRVRSFSQKQAAEFLGVDQPKISAIMNGKISGYTYDRLARYLAKFGRQVLVSIPPDQEQIECDLIVK